MQLGFRTVSIQERGGRRFELQKAIIDKRNAPAFWSSWRKPHIQEKLKRFVTLRREGAQWVAYRLYPADSGPPGTFDRRYYLKDSSKLLPYQIPAVEALCGAFMAHGAAVDGSDTGIGKTYHALALCREFSLSPGIICRKAGIMGWIRASGYMGIEPLFVLNWEMAKSGKTVAIKKYASGYQWNVPKNSIVIFDEAHMASNMGTINNTLYLSGQKIPSLSLSATFADRALRLEPLFSKIGLMTHEEFDAWISSRGIFYNAYDRPESLDDRTDLIAANHLLYPEYGARVSAEDPEVRKFFPDGIYRTEMVDIGDKNRNIQNKLYRDLLSQVEVFVAKGKQAEKLVADLRYRQAAELLKADVLADLVQNYQAQNMAVCVFVNFRDTLKYLAQKLKTDSLIFGGQDGTARQKVIDDFQADQTTVILCMGDAGGVSISLHDITGVHRRISLVCPNYNPVLVRQILGRTRRAGSKSTPVMKLVYAAGTIEEKVAQSVNNKLDNIAALNDGDLMEPDLFQMWKESKQDT